ncbi:hypothetical protein FDECE_2624 [Fusarium decemcellulare]|nr:hypothetical protein FDECE_2624 [Fusarium decemcellulare]
MSSSTTQAELPFSLRPMKVDIGSGARHMKELISNTRLPDEPLYPGLGFTKGLDLNQLREWKDAWLNDFDWRKEEEELNRFKHFTAVIDGLQVHFVHERADDVEAIPLVLLHGWPSSFLEFLPLVQELVQTSTTGDGKKVSFHVIIPSIPGYGLSGIPPEAWSVDDNINVIHKLVTEVLGYPKFAVHGTDIGCGIAYGLYARYSETCRAAHFSFIPFYPLLPTQLEEEKIELSTPLEKEEEEIFVKWHESEWGYTVVHRKNPTTIGLALHDNPVGQLAWMGEKWVEWSDPRQGTAPSILHQNDILRVVSLYYLTGKFGYSVYSYAQNAGGIRKEPEAYTKPKTDAPMLFNHEFGGHFPALDNPPAMITDLREIGTYWA